MSTLEGKVFSGKAESQFNLVSDITNNACLWQLRLRLIKQWRSKTKTGNEPGIDYIMIDRMGTPIHVKVIATLASQYLEVFQTNNLYEMYRFTAYKSTLGGRPVKHNHMLFLNSNTVVNTAEDNEDIPLHQKFEFVPLNKLKDHVALQHCIDVVGVITNWTNMKRAASGSVFREVYISDQDCSDVRVQLWDQEALAFDTNTIHEKAVLLMTSAAVRTYEQEGLMKLGLSSTGGTMVHIDLDIPEVKDLQESGIVVNIAGAPRNNIIIDWRKGRHAAIQEIVAAFKPYSKDETYVVRAQIVAFAEMYNYEACPTCNIKLDAMMKSKRCRKHGVVEHPKPSGFVKIEISDGATQQTVTLFDRQVRDIAHMTVEELAHYREAGVNVADFFTDLNSKIYLFEVKTKTYHGALSLSASKVELDEDSTSLVHPAIAAANKMVVPTSSSIGIASENCDSTASNPIAVEKRKNLGDSGSDNQKTTKMMKHTILE